MEPDTKMSTTEALTRVPPSKHHGTIITKLAAMLCIRQPRDDGFIDSDDIKPFIYDIRQAADALNMERIAALAQQAAAPAAPDAVFERLMGLVDDYVNAERRADRATCMKDMDTSQERYAIESALRTALQAVPQAGGLSDDEIDDIWAAVSDPERDDMNIHEFARAILARAGAVDGGR